MSSTSLRITRATMYVECNKGSGFSGKSEVCDCVLEFDCDCDCDLASDSACDLKAASNALRNVDSKRRSGIGILS
ncbi:hypothetical protein WICPIJ_010018 [Wickerhamomyces pijperi]|uniref:Uncharacterized protein n=1 Tax=Wickerhamomyces pijperi TaxID=599730 RepID=A0A9P8TAQ3_WICPI|nr:hypothetical protein WICPIJ_010018 [Wickerhamomyces pijperi]